jgi:hypothetical protein
LEHDRILPQDKARNAAPNVAEHKINAAIAIVAGYVGSMS